MVLIENRPVCTSCGARGSVEAGAQQQGHHHHHEDTHSAGASRSGPDELTRLRVLLPHWLEHNDEHLRDLRTWAAVARRLEQGPAADLLEQAILRFETGNQKLAAALEALAR